MKDSSVKILIYAIIATAVFAAVYYFYMYNKPAPDGTGEVTEPEADKTGYEKPKAESEDA